MTSLIMKRYVFLLFLFTTLSLVRVVQRTLCLQYGYKIAEMKDDEVRLLLENNRFSLKLAQLTSKESLENLSSEKQIAQK